MTEQESKRMLWRCRRGLLELDIVLQRFVEWRYARLDDGQLQAFDALLDLPDNDLWELVTQRTACTNQQQQEVLAMMAGE